MYTLTYIDAKGIEQRQKSSTWKFLSDQAKFVYSEGATNLVLRSHRTDLYRINVKTKQIAILAKGVLLCQATRAARDFMTEFPDYGIMMMPSSERKKWRRQG